MTPGTGTEVDTETGARIETERSGDSADPAAHGGSGAGRPTHVCALCRMSIRGERAVCPGCGGTVVAPVDEWERSEIIRHLSGGG